MTRTLHDKLRAELGKDQGSANRSNPKALINRIVQKARGLQRQDIDKWRKAMQRAIHPRDPRRDLLMPLYDDVMLDSHISGLWEHARKGRLFANDFQIVSINGGEIDQAMTDAFNEPWFFELMGHALDSKAYGHTLLEFGEVVKNQGIYGIDLLPRANVIPERGVILEDISSSKGIPYEEEDMVMEIGGQRDLGFLLKAAPMFLYKKGAMMAWSEYCEIFGMPLMVGTTESQDQADVDRMLDNMQMLGSAARAVMQQGENIEFKGDTKTDTYNVYDKHIDRANSELSKLILGSTGTTDMSKGAKAQAEVHERISDDVIQSDKRFIRGWANNDLIPFLLSKGWNLNGKKFEFPETKGQEALWAKTKDSMPYYDIDQDWMRDTFGVQVTERKEKGTEPGTESLKASIDSLYGNHFK